MCERGLDIYEKTHITLQDARKTMKKKERSFLSCLASFFLCLIPALKTERSVDLLLALLSVMLKVELQVRFTWLSRIVAAER